MSLDPVTLNIVLPVGISFYTFQTLSYTIDIFRGQTVPAKDIVAFAAFVSFFPQLVAGPIERARNLVPQFETFRPITPEHIQAGLYLVLWGLFKKVVIADRASLIADQVFNQHSHYSGLDIVVGVFAFAIQIYGDFSGYSDIARGLARLMGFELMVNFRLPYFAVNPSDFWNRWHISLSSWLRDYLYIPLGGNRHGTFNTYRNLFLTMLLGGLWHGAAWNFVLWGAYHGTILALYRRFERRPVHKDPWGGEHAIPTVLIKMAIMFVLTLYGWLLFRAQTFDQIVDMTTSMFAPHLSASLQSEVLVLALITLPLVIVQLMQYVTRDLLVLLKLPAPVQASIFGVMLVVMTLFSVGEQVEFIYFQF